jgi:hypothetical protein
MTPTMPIRLGHNLLLTAALLGPTPAAAGEPVVPNRLIRDGPIRPVSACLDPQRARSWVLLDSNTLYVDAGRRRYLLQLDMSCPELAQARSLSFRTGGGIGRICGHQGEHVQVDSAASWIRACRIGGVHIIPRSVPRLLTSQHVTTLRTRDDFFDPRRGDESPSYDVSRRRSD